jgi:hypothetical protein
LSSTACGAFYLFNTGFSAICSGVPVARIWPPPIAALRAQVDDPVGGLDHVQVVLDDDHGVAVVAQRCSTASSCSMSWKCRPVVGSSRM